jgi:hypothetical protein
LRDHLTGVINRSTENIDADIQAIQMKVDATETTVNAMQTQVNGLQTSIQQLTTSVNGLRVAIEQRQHEGHGDDDSVQGDNLNVNGRGRAPPLQGRGFAQVGRAQRVPLQDDDGLGKPKFTIPRFEGSTDVEEYLTWELKMEKLWRLDGYTEDRKIKLASSEFDGYALRWWDSIVRERREDNELPILTWRNMKEIMRARFVPTNYLRTVYDKLTQLKQVP